MITRGDLDYTALWILYAATALARIEILSARRRTDREVIPQAIQLNPAFFKIVYADLLNTKKTVKNVHAALDAIDAYLAEHAPALFGLILDHLFSFECHRLHRQHPTARHCADTVRDRLCHRAHRSR
jgi:uncharacterized protein